MCVSFRWIDCCLLHLLSELMVDQYVLIVLLESLSEDRMSHFLTLKGLFVLKDRLLTFMLLHLEFL